MNTATLLMAGLALAPAQNQPSLQGSTFLQYSGTAESVVKTLIEEGRISGPRSISPEVRERYVFLCYNPAETKDVAAEIASALRCEWSGVDEKTLYLGRSSASRKKLQSEQNNQLARTITKSCDKALEAFEKSQRAEDPIGVWLAQVNSRLLLPWEQRQRTYSGLLPTELLSWQLAKKMSSILATSSLTYGTYYSTEPTGSQLRFPAGCKEILGQYSRLISEPRFVQFWKGIKDENIITPFPSDLDSVVPSTIILRVWRRLSKLALNVSAYSKNGALLDEIAIALDLHGPPSDELGRDLGISLKSLPFSPSADTQALATIVAADFQPYLGVKSTEQVRSISSSPEKSDPFLPLCRDIRDCLTAETISCLVVAPPDQWFSGYSHFSTSRNHTLGGVFGTLSTFATLELRRHGSSIIVSGKFPLDVESVAVSRKLLSRYSASLRATSVESRFGFLRAVYECQNLDAYVFFVLFRRLLYNNPSTLLLMNPFFTMCRFLGSLPDVQLHEFLQGKTQVVNVELPQHRGFLVDLFEDSYFLIGFEAAGLSKLGARASALNAVELGSAVTVQAVLSKSAAFSLVESSGNSTHPSSYIMDLKMLARVLLYDYKENGRLALERSVFSGAQDEASFSCILQNGMSVKSRGGTIATLADKPVPISSLSKDTVDSVIAELERLKGPPQRGNSEFGRSGLPMETRWDQ